MHRSGVSLRVWVRCLQVTVHRVPVKYYLDHLSTWRGRQLAFHDDSAFMAGDPEVSDHCLPVPTVLGALRGTHYPLIR